MNKSPNPSRQPVELRVSKIRREPPPPVKQTVLPDDSENETWAVIIGVLAFALAISVLIFWVADYTSGDGEPPAKVRLTSGA
ncbi:MAG: hypothetical protein H0V46_01095 [Sphingomonas sp.]|nr:hypothetical protein [Sphingomonas sp.]